MERTIFIKRDTYGASITASFKLIKDGHAHQVSNTEQIVQLLMHDDTSVRLFEACWKEALSDGSIDRNGTVTVDMDDQDIKYLKEDAQRLESYASAKVNNPRSSFYIHGR